MSIITSKHMNLDKNSVLQCIQNNKTLEEYGVSAGWVAEWLIQTSSGDWN